MKKQVKKTRAIIFFAVVVLITVIVLFCPILKETRTLCEVHVLYNDNCAVFCFSTKEIRSIGSIYDVALNNILWNFLAAGKRPMYSSDVEKSELIILKDHKLTNVKGELKSFYSRVYPFTNKRFVITTSSWDRNEPQPDRINYFLEEDGSLRELLSDETKLFKGLTHEKAHSKYCEELGWRYIESLTPDDCKGEGGKKEVIFNTDGETLRVELLGIGTGQVEVAYSIVDNRGEAMYVWKYPILGSPYFK